MSDWWSLLIKPGLDLLNSGLRMAKGKFARRKYQQLLSEVVVELLKENPDMIGAEANLASLDSADVRPSRELLRAKQMFHSVRSFGGKVRRTTHRGVSGRKLYAVRDSKGRFKDIQTYERAHAQDLKRKTGKKQMKMKHSKGQKTKRSIK
jgi:hypothetical protein